MNIIIVGGVAAGMSCAARLRRLNEQANIIVLEKGRDISVASCGLPYYVGGEIADEATLRVQTPASISASLNLDIRVDHEALSVDAVNRTVAVRTPDGDQTLSYDALLLAPGARAARLPIPGIDNPAVRSLRTIDDAIAVRSIAQRGGRAVVIGAGFIGIEAAENLHLAGMDVALVEGSDHVLPPVEEELSSLVRIELERLGIAVIESARVKAIDEGEAGARVVVEGIEPLDADLVLVAIGARARTELAESAGLDLVNGAIGVNEFGRTSAPRIWAAGDAVASTIFATGARRPVALAGPASRAGRRIADDIIRVLSESGVSTPDSARAFPRPIASPLGTSIVRVGDLEVAMTGVNARELRAADKDFTTLHVHHAQHVGYFPGASTIALLAHIDSDGRLLGAQAVGEEGVARRIDVLATAIRAGMTVEQLVDLDLAYAPPFGAPKDPVNMLGMVGENVRDSQVVLWYPWDLEAIRATHLILDVRQPREVAQDPTIPGALAIPHTQLRVRMDEVRDAADGRPIAVHCRSGVRSYLAARMLEDAGYTAISLSGGMLTLEAWAIRHPGLIDS